jgi:hypothetical protein
MGRLAGCVLLAALTLGGCTSVVAGQPTGDGRLPTRAAVARTLPPPKPRAVTVSAPGLVQIAPSYDVESLTVQTFTAKGEITLVARFPPGQGAFTCFYDNACAFGAHGNEVQFIAHVGAHITINNLMIEVLGVHGPDKKHPGAVMTLQLSVASP